MSRASRMTCAAAVAAAIFTACIHPAAALTVFLIQTGNWFVTTQSDACVAVNRPLYEYLESPYNSMTLIAPKEGNPFLEVAFWPGLFEAGQHYKLTLRPNNGGSHEIDTEALSPHALKTLVPIPDKLLQNLGATRMLRVATTNVPSSLAFDTMGMNDILYHLESCRGLIGKE